MGYPCRCVGDRPPHEVDTSRVDKYLPRANVPPDSGVPSTEFSSDRWKLAWVATEKNSTLAVAVHSPRGATEPPILFQDDTSRRWGYLVSEHSRLGDKCAPALDTVVALGHSSNLLHVEGVACHTLDLPGGFDHVQSPAVEAQRVRLTERRDPSPFHGCLDPQVDPAEVQYYRFAQIPLGVHAQPCFVVRHEAAPDKR